MTDVPLVAGLADAPIGVAVLSDELTFLWVNTALADINRRPAAAHVGRTVTDVLGPAADAWVGYARTVVADGHPIGPVRIGGPPAGGGRAFEATYLPVDDHGRRLVVALVQEVTAQVDAARRLEVLGAVTAALAVAMTMEDIGRAVTSSVALSYVDRVSFVTIDGDVATTVDLAGYPPALVERWRGRPTRLVGDNPVTECVATGRAVITGTGADFDERYPGYSSLRRQVGDEATITAPVIVDGAVTAAIHVTWAGPARMGPFAVDTTTTLAGLVGLAVRRLRTTEQLELDRFRHALDAMIDEITICSAIRDEDGAIVDFRLDFVKDGFQDRSGRTAAELIGRRVLECYPNWPASGIFDRFRGVVERGTPLVEERLEYEDVLPDGSTYTGVWRVQVVPFGDGFLSTSRDITEQVRAEEELAHARIRLITERESVRLLHELSLPTELPDVHGVTVAAHYRPADVEIPVGGDWYDVSTTEDGRLVLVIGDVAGHGRSAASTMIRLRNVTNAFARTLTSPADILAATARSLRGDRSVMATCLVVVYDPATSAVTACSAGHLPPVLRDAKEARVWAVDPGLPLGVEGDRPYCDVAVTIAEPCVLVMYTDGLVERRGSPLDDSIGELADRIGASLDPYRPDRLLHEVVEHVADDLHEDDFCVVAVGIDPAAASSTGDGVGGGPPTP